MRVLLGVAAEAAGWLRSASRVLDLMPLVGALAIALRSWARRMSSKDGVDGRHGPVAFGEISVLERGRCCQPPGGGWAWRF